MRCDFYEARRPQQYRSGSDGNPDDPHCADSGMRGEKRRVFLPPRNVCGSADKRTSDRGRAAPDGTERRKGADAPRFGALKPVGLTDPRTGRRPWAALQLRAEDAHGMAYNLVGFQTNLTFGEQQRVFRLIPGLEHAEFARYGVMHRNTFVDAPRLLDATLRLKRPIARIPVRIAGQLAGTEGYCEAMRSGLHAALCTCAELADAPAPIPPAETAFGALLAWATDPATVDYQPMHVNFGIIPPLEARVRNKKDRYAAYAARGTKALEAHVAHLQSLGLLAESTGEESAHSHADNAAGQDAPATVSPAVCAKVDGLGRNVAFIASEGTMRRG